MMFLIYLFCTLCSCYLAFDLYKFIKRLLLKKKLKKEFDCEIEDIEDLFD